MMRRAYTQLRAGRPYPVLVEMPNDVLAAEISEEQFHYQPSASGVPPATPGMCPASPSCWSTRGGR